jgi:hypothetical protein
MRENFEVIDRANREQLDFVREGEPILSLPGPSDEIEDIGKSE